MSKRCVPIGLLVFLLTVPVGCEKQPTLYEVSGTVLYEGKPVPMGQIRFNPDGDGTQGFATIRDGKYTTTVEGRGVVGGSHTIQILAYDGKVANETPLGKGLRPEYTEKKDLPFANTELNFDLKAPPKAKP